MSASLIIIPGAPSTKRALYVAATGGTYTAAIYREADGYLLDWADGSFSDAPATPAGALVETPASSGRYLLDEATERWNDGAYTLVVSDGSGVVGGTTIVLGGDLPAPAAAPGLLEYAVATLAEVAAELRLTGETSEYARITAAINEATDQMETVTGRRIKRRAAAMTLYFDIGEDEEDQSELWPPEWPFEAADIVSLKTSPDGDFTSSSTHTYTSDEFRVEGGQRIVLLDAAAVSFYEGAQTVQLVFTPGYSTPLTDIVGVCKSKAARIFWRDKGVQVGVEQTTLGGQTVRLGTEAWTKPEQAVLDRYTRPKDYVRARRDGKWCR